MRTLHPFVIEPSFLLNMSDSADLDNSQLQLNLVSYCSHALEAVCDVDGFDLSCP